MNGEIKRTTDYGRFKLFNVNREIKPEKVKKLVKSIKKIGWISKPILVDKKMRIIDGQHRFEALKQLGMPIEYIVVDIKSENVLPIIHGLNGRGSTDIWNTYDYIHSYSESGNNDYQRVQFLMKYFDVTLDVLMMAKNLKITSNGSSGSSYQKMRDGELKFTESDYVNVSKILNIYKLYKPIFEKFGGRTRTKDNVIMFLIAYGNQNNNLDHAKMIETLRGVDPKTIYNTGFDRLLESIQNAYNFNKSKKNRLYFYEEYRLDKIG